MPIIRVPHKRDFTIISNRALKDSRLSLREIGLLCVMLRLPDNWRISAAGLAALCRDGRDAIRAAMSTLECYGYLRRETSLDPLTHLRRTVYTVVEQPEAGYFTLPEEELLSFAEADFPTTENPTPEIPTPESPQTAAPTPGGPTQYNTNKPSNGEPRKEQANTEGIDTQKTKNIPVHGFASLQARSVSKQGPAKEGGNCRSLPRTEGGYKQTTPPTRSVSEQGPAREGGNCRSVPRTEWEYKQTPSQVKPLSCDFAALANRLCASAQGRQARDGPEKTAPLR